MTKLQWSGVGNVGGVQDPATAQRSARLFPNDGARGSGWLATWMGFLWPVAAAMASGTALDAAAWWPTVAPFSIHGEQTTLTAGRDRDGEFNINLVLGHGLGEVNRQGHVSAGWLRHLPLLRQPAHLPRPSHRIRQEEKGHFTE